MNKKLTIIHTTPATISSIPTKIKSIYDHVDIVNVLDDSMLNDIKQSGFLTKAVIERFVQYVIIAKNNNSDAVLLACSSIGVAGDIAREIVDIPLYKIDEPMALQAVEKGDNILVLGTVQSTLEPTSKLIEKHRKNSTQKVTCKLINGAFELYSSDKESHDRKIATVVNENLSQFDVIVLAQASMSEAIKYVEGDRGMILTSLPLGLEQLEATLGGN